MAPHAMSPGHNGARRAGRAMIGYGGWYDRGQASYRAVSAAARRRDRDQTLGRCRVPSGFSMSGERDTIELIALVIGNRAYEFAATVENAAQDAVAMADALGLLGYSHTGPSLDTRWIALDRAITDFKAATADAEVAVFYYAGHSLQVDGINYLLPVEAEVESRRSLIHYGVPLDHPPRFCDGDQLLAAARRAVQMDRRKAREPHAKDRHPPRLHDRRRAGTPSDAVPDL